MKKTFCLFISLLFISLSALQCLTDSEKDSPANNTKRVISQDSPNSTIGDTKKEEKKDDEINESFRKIGWIKDNKYRALVFIITPDECRNSSMSDIKAKLELAAFTSLNKELNPTANRNASAQIKKMIDSFGEMKQVDKNCNSENIFFYDIVKKDLKSEFEKIRNTK